MMQTVANSCLLLMLIAYWK